MGVILVLLDLAGSVALLMWGVHMVQTGISRAFGADLRRLLSAVLGNRLRALATGVAATALLQSSTATALMTSSLVASGVIDLVSGLAVMLGANVGTTLIVQAMSFNVGAIAPVAVLFGVTMFRRASLSRGRDIGRALIGLGLMLLALSRLPHLVSPFEDGQGLRMILSTAASQPILDVLLAACAAWAAHSSVAIVFVSMSLAAKGVVTPVSALALVVGANLGSAVNPILERSHKRDKEALRLPLGNLLNRLVGCLIILPSLPLCVHLFASLEPDIARQIADFHTGFNLLLAVLMFPVLGPITRLLTAWLPTAVKDDPTKPQFLDPGVRENPALALACASREALRMTDTLEQMIFSAINALAKNDRGLMESTTKMDDTIDHLNVAIKTYLTHLGMDDLSEKDHRRLYETLTFITNIEHAGDVLDHNIMSLLRKALKRGLSLSPGGRADITTMLERLAVNVRTAAAVYVAEDTRAARHLVEEKVLFREIEAKATLSHFDRLWTGEHRTSQTSALHLDIIRDLKRINAHLVEAAAYPILNARGELLTHRMRSK